MIIGIIAISKNYAIGKDGKLPWHYSADLKFFKKVTTDNAVVMGSNTWRAIGKPLPDRLNIVLSRSGNVDTPPDVMRLGSVDEVVELSENLNHDIFIIGGARSYAAFADFIDKWFVTEIPIDVPDADTFMPLDFLAGFEQVDKIEVDANLFVKTFRRSAE